MKPFMEMNGIGEEARRGTVSAVNRNFVIAQFVMAGLDPAIQQ
jgi:hypothetical protein